MGNLPESAGFQKDGQRSVKLPLVLLQSIKGFWEEFEHKILDTRGHRQNSGLGLVVVVQLIKLNTQ